MSEKKTDAAPRTASIRALNDQFRRHGRGRGSLMVTAGVQALGDVLMMQVMAAVQGFTAFDNNNDPYQEHDFGAIDVAGETVFFKIDYYDLSLAAGSPDPADEAVTHRVLTVMLASEY